MVSLASSNNQQLDTQMCMNVYECFLCTYNLKNGNIQYQSTIELNQRLSKWVDKYVNFFNLYYITKNAFKQYKSDFRGDCCGFWFQKNAATLILVDEAIPA